MNLKYIFGIIVIEISWIYGIYHKKVVGVWGKIKMTNWKITWEYTRHKFLIALESFSSFFSVASW